ncbi:hypothetical protein ID866_8016, partial [Astraeus odoratus]
AFSSVRNEIDKGVREVFGGIQPFLAEASPANLNTESFALLNSAILETLRLSAVLSSLRVSQRDFDLKDSEGTIPIRKDDYILLDTRAAHRSEGSYPDGDKFIFDRFVSKEYENDITSAASKPFFAFGAGKHLCKGRFLIIYEIKVLFIVYLSLFDITPVSNVRGASWKPPQPSAQSLGTMHTTEDVFVKLKPRSAL